MAHSDAGLTALNSGTAVQCNRWVRERGFLGISALLFIASAMATVCWCRSMSGAWTMSMTWMRMSGQTWLGAAASFVGMWIVMMIAMMLPSLVPTMLRYRGTVRERDETRLGTLTALVGVGYLFGWTIFGAAAYPVGLVLTRVEMRWPTLARSVPVAIGIVLLLAGCAQFTGWKARQLGHCRNAPASGQSLDARNAWRYGLTLGVRCILCCFGFMIILLATGVMDLGIMAIVTAAITIERLSPRLQHAHRAVGVGIISAGILVTVRAFGIA